MDVDETTLITPLNASAIATRPRIQAAAAADLTGLTVRTIQARAPEIPGAAKLFGRWTFDPIKLQRWIVEMEAALCRVTSTDGAPSGGAVSRSPASSIAEA